jgi:serine/threonine protein kinase
MVDPVAADPRIGTEFAGYRIKRVLGRRGELSVVYVAEDGRSDREVALKLLVPQLAADARFRERFQLELRLAASLDHPNTIPLYEAGEAEGVLFIAMRYVEGADLAKRLARGHLSPGYALSILEPVADALDAAHAHGLIHGGVKPTNILTSDAGHVYLADFGLGHPRDQTCAAPEQRGDGEVSARTDVYALTCVLFMCLTGELPPSDDATDAGPHDERPPAASRNAELPLGIDAVLAKGMAKSPLDRHRSARELTDDARRVLMPYGEDAAPRMARRRKRRKRAALAVLVISAMLAIGVALAVLFAGGDNRGPGDRRPPPTDGTLI